MSCLIGQSLAACTSHRNPSALRVIDAELGASVHAKIELREVSIKMFFVHVLIDANQTALEDTEKSFKGVGVNITARPFVLGMIYRFMLRFIWHDGEIGFRAIGNQAACRIQVLADSAAHVAMIQIHGADVAAALDQREHLGSGLGVQRNTGSLAGLRRFGQISFIGLNGHAKAAQRASIGTRGHGQADAMAHEPRGFHAATEHPLKLAGADTFLGRTHQVDRLQPMRHRRVTILEDGSDLDGKLLAAFIAFAQPWARGFSRQLTNTSPIAIAAVRAYRTGRPEISLYVFVGGFFIFEMRGAEVRVHVFGSSVSKECAYQRGVSRVTSPVAMQHLTVARL
jgi:hypothetical protein